MASPKNLRVYFPHKSYFVATAKPAPESLSPFDRTLPTNVRTNLLQTLIIDVMLTSVLIIIQERAGAHVMSQAVLDDSAFNHLHRRIDKPDPNNFIKSGEAVLALAKVEKNGAMQMCP